MRKREFKPIVILLKDTETQNGNLHYILGEKTRTRRREERWTKRT